MIDAGAERVLVYCQFQQSADALANVYIARVGVGEAVAFHGGYGPGERDARLECFKRGKAHVLFATMQSAGTGIDGLQGVCDTAVIVEYPWNPGSMWQAEDRLHRSGQKNPVQIHCLVEDDSIESSILKLALNKSEKIDIAVDDHVDAENVVDGNSWWP
jgi:SNF2 family DNA or RNA helicase